jgi:FMN phosphatase YigB (HAD superfamily)
VTTYEVSTACKPLPGYFIETAAAVGCAPDGCVMIGDDAKLDLPAAATGMRTFYVGPDRHAQADDRGSLADLVQMIERL